MIESYVKSPGMWLVKEILGTDQVIAQRSDAVFIGCLADIPAQRRRGDSSAKQGPSPSATQTAAASAAPNGDQARHQSLTSAVRATLATQSEGPESVVCE